MSENPKIKKKSELKHYFSAKTSLLFKKGSNSRNKLNYTPQYQFVAQSRQLLLYESTYRDILMNYLDTSA